MKITVVGIGYVGLVTSVCLANIGHKIVCYDISKEKIGLLKKLKSPIYESGIDELLIKNKDRLSFTTNSEDAFKNSNIVIIAVGTPENNDGSTNLKYLEDTIKEFSKYINNDCILVIKSTVPIGTNDIIEKKLNSNLKYNISVVSNPEFLSQGSAVRDTLFASRIIIGANSKKAENIIKNMYLPLNKDPYNVPIVIMDRKSAELVKYASNCFLAMKISYINEIANLCEKVDANILNVVEGMKYDARIGDKFLHAGIGFGGSCFPKDTKSLYKFSIDNNCELKLIKSTIDVNEKQKMILLDKLEKNEGCLKNKTIAILGLTFKANTDDIRESPANYIVPELLNKKCFINVYDPVGLDNFKKYMADNFQNNDMKYFTDIDSTIVNADYVLIINDWDIIKNYKLSKYVSLMKKPIIYDGRNLYNIEEIRKFDIKYYPIGINVERVDFNV